MNWQVIFYFTSLLYAGHIVGGDLVSEVAKKAESPKIFTTITEEKQKLLESLTKKRAEIVPKGQELLQEANVRLRDVREQLQAIRQSLLENSEDPFLNNKLALLNDLYQILKDIPLEWEKVVGDINSTIKQLSEYLDDPNLQVYKDDLLKGKVVYSFEEFQQLHQQLGAQEKRVADLDQKLKNAYLGLEGRKQAAAATIETYKRKQQEFEQRGKSKTSLIFDAQQRDELWNLEEQLFRYKKQLDELRIQEFEYKIELLKTKQFIARLRRDVLKEVVRQIKSSIRISEADVAFAKDELAKKKQQAFVVKNRYRQEIDKLAAMQKSQEQSLDTISKQYNISLDKELDEWSKQPKQAISSYLDMYTVGNLNEQVLLLKRRKEWLNAQVALEDARLRYEDILIEAKDVFRKIVSSAPLSEEQVVQERKKFEVAKAELNAIRSDITASASSAQDLLERKKSAIENIQKRREELQKAYSTVFRGHTQEYNQCIELLNSIHEKLKVQLDIITKLVGAYADVLNTVEKTSRQIDFIIAELASVPVVWHRPEYAITLDGLKHVPSDLAVFGSDLKAYLLRISFKGILEGFASIFAQGWHLIWIVLKLAFICLSLLVYRKLLPYLIAFFMRRGSVSWGIGVISLLIAAVLGFFAHYFVLWLIWILLYALLYISMPTDPFIPILFYLLSIPYFLYLAHKLVAYISLFNKRYSHVFWEPEFEKRVVFIVSMLLYAAIILLFFRQAFMLGNYRRSELPTILLAINFIIFQISLIALIAKELILSTIPTETEWWRRIYSYIDRYYYFIMALVVVVIVMSNPYVGFGKLVLYIAVHIAYTILLLFALFWVHLFLKKTVSHIFFLQEQDLVQERFTQAKTWYGVAIITIFLSFTFLGVLFIAKIWGWPETLTTIRNWHDFVELLKTPFLLQQTESPISAYSILYIVFFIMFGAGIAFAINHFVLERIYDILSIDIGIQNTISSLSRSLIITTATILAFQAVGLASLVTYLIGALIIGIGWVIKDPIADVLAYFIILVQRPLKIGDYVGLDAETVGVVRNITPRSVVIRKKNSMTIVVPNTSVINKPISNWNYSRGFFAFDDILITVAYSADPHKTRSILLKVLEDNPYILKHPRPVVRLDSFGEYGFVFMVRGYLSSNYTLDMWDIASDVRLTIVSEFKKHGIEIALQTKILLDYAERIRKQSPDEKMLKES